MTKRAVAQGLRLATMRPNAHSAPVGFRTSELSRCDGEVDDVKRVGGDATRLDGSQGSGTQRGDSDRSVRKLRFQWSPSQEGGQSSLSALYGPLRELSIHVG